MNIIEAMIAASKGAKVRRVGRKSSYVFYVPGNATPRESIFIGKKAGRFESWFCPAHKDFTAEWEVVDDASKEQSK